MRTIVDLTETQLIRLQQVATRENISRAEAVRRAIDLAYPAEAVRDVVRSRRQTAFGLWHARQVNAQQYVDELRDEWNR